MLGAQWNECPPGNNLVGGVE